MSPDIVLLSAAWEMYMAAGASEGEILAVITDEVGWLKEFGIQRIVLFGPVSSWETSSDIFMYMRRNRLSTIPDRLGDVSSEVQHLDATPDMQAIALHVEYVSVIHRFCNPSGCLILGDQNLARPDLLYRDHDHLTPTGSRLRIEAAQLQIFALPSGTPGSASATRVSGFCGCQLIRAIA